MKLRLYIASAIVLCLVTILVLLGAQDVERSLRLSNELHGKIVPTLRYLEQTRFGVLRIVSSTSEFILAKVTGAAEDKEGAAPNKAAETEMDLIQEGQDASLAALKALRELYRAGGSEPPDYVRLREMESAYASLAASSRYIITLARQSATPKELGEAKESFEELERHALATVDKVLAEAQRVTDRKHAELSSEIGHLREEIVTLGLLAMLVLILYSVFVGRTLQREAQARLEAERLAEANANEVERRKRIEGRLAAHQKMEALGTMIGGIAHSVNNLLVPVITLSKMLKKDAPEGSELHDDLGRIQASGEKASRLLKEALAFSRTDQAANPGNCELVECLRRAVSLAQAAMPPSVSVHVACLMDEAWVPREEAEIDTMVFNLFGNAVDAMEHATGRIDVKLERVSVDQGLVGGVQVQLKAGDYARLSIADDGRGIPEKALPHVFEPFFTTKEVGKGTGLGLSVIYSSLAQVGGDIVVSSKPGSGTRFDLFLPLLPAGGAGTTTEKEHERG